MKISVFLDRYQPFHEEKDPGQIPLGLLEIGTSSDVIALSKNELKSYKPKFGLVQKSPTEINTVDFWSHNDSDVIIVYSPWFIKPYSPFLEKIKQGGKKIIIKFDSDGRVGYPFKPSYLRIPLRERLTLKDTLFNLLWSLPFKSLHSAKSLEIIKQIELSDGVVIESPEALSNLDFFLTKWSRKDLIKKTHFVPNPVSPEFIEASVGSKDNLIIAFGRWDDWTVKNTKTMVRVLTEFLEERNDYRAKIFGTGTEMVSSLLKYSKQNLTNRVQSMGPVEHRIVPNLLSKAKVAFLPSRWESFSIGAAESICMGCSIVGTPLESLRYLSMQGFSGTIAPTFEKEAILTALLQDSRKWDDDSYQPAEVAAFWRQKLNRAKIAQSIHKLAAQL